MKIGRRNKVSTDIFSYNIGLIGESGIGKTTVIHDALEKLCPDGYLFAECGKEDGEEAIENINAVKVIDWDSDYDEEENTVGFRTLVDDIVDNKSTDYKELKTIAWDTYDELCQIAKEEVVRLHNKQHPDKRVSSVKAAFGGYMAGDDMANQMIIDALWELKRVGVSFIIIGHTKLRDQQDIATGETYTQLTTNMALRDFNAIKTKLHFLGVAYKDRSIAKEKSKKDSKKTIGVITGEERKIVFRSDDFSMDSKSRFSEIASEIPLDADAFIEALQDAIDAELNKNGVDKKKREKEDKAIEKKKVEKVAEENAARATEKEIETLTSFIKTYCADCKENGDKDKIMEVMAFTKELGYSNPLEIDNLEDAQKVYDFCNK